MDIYKSTFVGLLLLNGVVLYRSYRAKPVLFAKEHPPNVNEAAYLEQVDADAERVLRLKWRFLPVYLLVTGADWLQGPYIYPIYKDEKGLTESVVALLFMTGFLSGGISASFAGAFADRFGRKLACLAYCVVYSLSCLTLLADNILLLFAGRILGGLSATLLYSVFESWLVAEFNQLRLLDGAPTLSGIFSIMTTLNSLVAIVVGVIAEWLFGAIGTAKAPFMASMACLSVAFVLIAKSWSENYGARRNNTLEARPLLANEQVSAQTLPSKSVLRLIFQDAKILTLGFTSCFFEGSLFLFVFFKFPALESCHGSNHLPFGLIFAMLMCSMMFGSILYRTVLAMNPDVPVKRPLCGLLAVASLCFLLPALLRIESLTLWCFCIFEVCCGMYYPAMASLKGRLIDDGVRASVYGILRIPLNMFVVIALSMTREGEQYRNTVFTICSALLLVAAGVAHRMLE